MLKLGALASVEPSADLTEEHAAWFRELAASLVDGGRSAGDAAHALVVPGRIELLGKHTDYAGGRSLTCATEQGICLLAAARRDRRVKIDDPGRRVSAAFEIDATLDATAPDWTRFAKTVIRRLARDFGQALDGLYEAVRARTLDADPRDLAWRRAGMSRAFLDAPRSLVRWRVAALAACAVLVVGAGLVATRHVDVVVPGAPEDLATTAADPRDDLLRRLSPVAAEQDDEPAAWVREVDMRPRRAGGPPRRFHFTLVPRRDMDTRSMLDAVPAVPVRAAPPAGDLETN